MNKEERAFQRLVLEYYERNGRHDLPWRLTHEPYAVLVSELMLQQTQVERVKLKYEAFMKRWPTVQSLARARLASVLKEWQGLGYNRRAKFLHECARTVMKRHDGTFPRDESTLRELPGIGPYTAAAMMAFAYNEPVVLIETNVRRVFLHRFFPERTNVADAEILPLVAKTLPSDKSRVWYSALMDYGTHLKSSVGNANVRSKHYAKQSAFKGSNREIRGAILRLLTKGMDITLEELLNDLASFEADRVHVQVERLRSEGLIRRRGGRYRIG